MISTSRLPLVLWLSFAGVIAIACVGEDPSFAPSNQPSVTDGGADGAAQLGFTIDVDPPLVSVTAGQSAELTVRVVRTGGFADVVDLVLGDLPAGASANAASVAPGVDTAKLTVSADATAAHRKVTAKVTATAGALMSTMTFDLFVRGASGQLDSSFGEMGKTLTDFGGNANERAYAMVVQPDGKIVLVGNRGDAPTRKCIAARYTADGVLDTSFGSAGKVVIDFSPDDPCNAVAIDSKNRSVDIALARFKADGAPDTTFGNAGKTSYGVGTSSHQQVNGMRLQDDGKIVVAGAFTNGTPNPDVFVARFGDSGAIDPSFGNAGIAVTRSWEATTHRTSRSTIRIALGRVQSRRLGAIRRPRGCLRYR